MAHSRKHILYIPVTPIELFHIFFVQSETFPKNLSPSKINIHYNIINFCCDWIFLKLKYQHEKWILDCSIKHEEYNITLTYWDNIPNRIRKKEKNPNKFEYGFAGRHKSVFSWKEKTSNHRHVLLHLSCLTVRTRLQTPRTTRLIYFHHCDVTHSSCVTPNNRFLTDTCTDIH